MCVADTMSFREFLVATEFRWNYLGCIPLSLDEKFIDKFASGHES
jgi:hypothetical protein